MASQEIREPSSRTAKSSLASGAEWLERIAHFSRGAPDEPWN